MKKTILILILIILTINVIPINFVSAAENYNHSELLEFEGYGQALYESIVRETTFLTGQYTDNKEYVTNSIDQIVDYGNFWKDEFYNFQDDCQEDGFTGCMRNMIEYGGGYLLTVGDWFKKLFGDYDDSINSTDEVDYSFFENALYMNDDNVVAKEGWAIEITKPNGETRNTSSFTTGISRPSNYRYLKYSIKLGGMTIYTSSEEYGLGSDSNKQIVEEFRSTVNTVSGQVANLYRMGGSLKVFYEGVEKSPTTIISDKTINNIRNFIDQGGLDNTSIPIPKPIPELTCPSGYTTKLTVSGAIILGENDVPLNVSMNGDVILDNETCTLNWKVPNIYYDENGNTVVEEPDGKIIDVGTGEIVGGKDYGEGCEGVLCFLGGIAEAIGDLIKAILGIPLKIIELLWDFIIKIVEFIFIPEDNYWSSNMDKLNSLFWKKDIEKMVTDFKGIEASGGGIFEDIKVSLLGVGGLEVVDADSINSVLTTVHKWVRGVFFPLLLLFNINSIYKLIRGTDLTSFTGTYKRRE